MKNPFLPPDNKGSYSFCGNSVRSRIRIAASSDVPVFLIGAPGTDKNGIARIIHDRSCRKLFPYHRFDCSLYSDQDCRSLLFGDPGTDHLPGRLRQTWGGTLFLENADLLSDGLKTGILPYLSTKENTDIRFIISFRNPIESSLAEDLSVFEHEILSWPIRIPSLKDRPLELPRLIDRYLACNAELLALPVLPLTKNEYRILCDFDWPENHEQLNRVLYRALLSGRGQRLAISEALSEESAEDSEESPIIPSTKEKEDDSFPTLDDAMRDHIRKALEKSHGRIDGDQGAAQLLAIHPNTLRARMHKLGLL
ncbi:MAG: sigma 54-interacting transcriptional regulator [Planctomycetia bacterium]|nr:sigma 54-interacting transcriptional regulator [Planctomycetia bacterium]